LTCGLDIDIGFGAVCAVCEFVGDVGAFGVLFGGLSNEGDGVGDPDAVVFQGVGGVASALRVSPFVARAALAVARLVLSVAAVVVSVMRHGLYLVVR
jgi:hypothetical protein